MKRRNFLQASLVAATSTTFLSCDTSNDTGYGPIVHSVYFWLKEDITAAEESDFVNFFEALKKIPNIQTLKYGKPALTNPRPVVDSSFSYNLIVTFSTMDAINVYETHPDHLAAIDKYQKYWTNVKVFDTML